MNSELPGDDNISTELIRRGDKKIKRRNSCTNKSNMDIRKNARALENCCHMPHTHTHTKGDKLQLQKNLPIKCML